MKRRIKTAKLILPALTEATSPYWRPIKYSLFPPLGLATLAAYLDEDTQIQLVDEHVEAIELDNAPDLVVIQVYITNAKRAYRLADHYRSRGSYVALGGLHVTALPDEVRATLTQYFSARESSPSPNSSTTMPTAARKKFTPQPHVHSMACRRFAAI
jgi:hypothetical protein